MSLDTFFQLLDAEEADIHARAEQARAQLAEFEQIALRLAQARETAVALLAKAPSSTPTDGQAAASGVTHDDTEPRVVPTPEARSSIGRPLGQVSNRIMALLGSSDRSWNARDLAIALGNPAPSRKETAAMRNKLRGLKESGHVVRTSTGLYAAAQQPVTVALQG